MKKALRECWLALRPFKRRGVNRILRDFFFLLRPEAWLKWERFWRWIDVLFLSSAPRDEESAR
jgi:hypothetical protein